MKDVRDFFWKPAADPGVEHLRLAIRRDVLVADGLIVRWPPGSEPFRARYRLRFDVRTKALAAVVRVESGGRPRRLELHGNGSGRWKDRDGRRLHALDGCVDLDITATPFTNTLPIRRLGLKPGEAADIPVAWIHVPALRLERAHQRYTCLRVEAGGATYLYENPGTKFRAELPVDADGIVRDYPGFFVRWEPRPHS